MTGRDDERAEPSERRTEKVDLNALGADAAGPGRPTEQVDTSAARPTEKVDTSSVARHRRPDAQDPVQDTAQDTAQDVPAGVDDDTPPSGVPAAAGSGSGAPAAVGAGPGEVAETGGRRGRVRYQDPETARPREPTVAEQRARREAQRRERAQADAAAAAEERKRKVRKRVLVGGGVAVGVVALVAVVYAASQPDEVTAQCVDPAGVVVPDEECDRPPTGGYYDSTGAFVPIFIGGFGNQYHYNYGSNAPLGSVARGGTTTPPASGTSVRSGTTGSSLGSTSNGTVSRGGLGVNGGSSGTSGRSGGSSSGGGSSSSGS